MIRGAIAYAILIYALVAMVYGLWMMVLWPTPRGWLEPLLQVFETIWKMWSWPVLLALRLRRIVGRKG